MFSILVQEGKGGFGSVFFATDKITKEKVALKKLIHETEDQQRSNLSEVAFLSKLAHPNIISLRGVYHEPKTHHLWLVLEFMDGGTIEMLIPEKFESRHLAYIFQQVVSALSFMHKHMIGHCDIKPGNIMVNQKGEIKLVDFGLCCEFFLGPRTGIKGTSFWIPPEMIKLQPYTTKVDVWSMGVVLLELTLGRLPYENGIVSMFNSATVGLVNTIPPDIQPDHKHFLELCLTVDPNLRPTSEELLEHKWVKGPQLGSGFLDACYQLFIIKAQMDFIQMGFR
eukprot:TRINITY_DN7558_c0_g1_i3.p1 TRINITY_DN7558_c0_g1~~TRINITY_DN7558_c0_g1_i3.p1  ORF type:complete len:281 (-),score=48.78 TRINITY_DN7558_c0_g1_i3:166-1008(-)